MKRKVTIEIEEALSPIGYLYIVSIGAEQARVLKATESIDIRLTETVWGKLSFEQREPPDEYKLLDESENE